MVARDFESAADTDANNVYELTIIATDSEGNNDAESWTVTVNDVTEITGDTNGDGTIGSGEIAGDIDGDGTIGSGEIAGDIDGDGVIEAGEIAGDINGDGAIGTGEITGDINGDGTIGSGEVEGDTYGDGDGTLGNETFDDFSFNIYPNPTNSIVKIIFNKDVSVNAEINIYNTIGQSVFATNKEIRNNEIVLDISVLPSGNYFLNIKNEIGVISKKLIKN
tara:strand:- start:76534 stop:77196 length:663 start_codon:yes stop_codon:yes gene_type:complete